MVGLLDAISISAYFPVAEKRRYSTADLVEGWRDWAGTDWVARVDAVRRRFGLPVIFGEIGYRTITGGAVAPWAVERRDRFSAQAQARAYEAALRVWYRVPWLRGLYWWYVTPRAKSGEPGADHVPAAPARRVLRRWYRSAR